MAKSFKILEQRMPASARPSAEERALKLMSEMLLGGDLEITARFPEGEIRIGQFDLGRAPKP